MKKIFTVLMFIGAMGFMNLNAQVVLTGTSYAESFDGIAGGLPTGWSIYNNVTATADGDSQSLITAATAWNNSTNNFRNSASADGLASTASSADQSNSTDRVIAVKQGTSGAVMAPAYVCTLSNTTGFKDFSLTFKMQSLVATSPRVATWYVQYKIGTGSWTTVTTNPASFTTGNKFSNENIAVNFGSALDNVSSEVKIRIYTVTATGSGNGAISAIDDFALVWSNLAPPANDDATLSTLKIDDTTIDGFNPTTLIYSYQIPYLYSGVPTVTATVNSASATAVITQATTVPGSATVVVTAEDGITKKTYTVNFTKAAPNPVLTVSPTNLPFGEVMFTTSPAKKTVTVSGSELTANITYTVEGDVSVFAIEETSWTAAAGGTLTVTFTPAATQTYAATLKISSEGAADKTVNLTGEGIPYTVIISEWKGYPDNTVTSESTTYVHPKAGTDANRGNADLTITGATFETGVAGSVSGTFAPNSKAWDGDLSTDKYWQVTFNTEGYNNLKVTSKQQGSNTGPKDFKIQYLNGSSWTDLTGGTITVANNFTSGVIVRLGLPVVLADKKEVSLRWIRTSTSRISGADPVAAGGTDRIEITITGDEIIPDPELAVNFSSLSFTTSGEEKTVTITAAHLTEKITITSDSPAFVVTPDELPASTTTGTFAVRVSGATNATGTITVTSSGITRTIGLDATINVGLQADFTSSVSVSVENNTLFIKNVRNEDPVLVYDITGKLFKKTTNKEIALPYKGIYIVKIGDKVFKIINKG